jgi:hypothetical protein
MIRNQCCDEESQMYLLMSRHMARDKIRTGEPDIEARMPYE